MGLIARQIEAAGIPTLCLGSALSILGSVFPPRLAFVDFPLGHTAGKPNDPEGQLRLLRQALRGFEFAGPGRVLRVDEVWSEDDSWKDEVMRPDPENPAAADNRTERHATPQYQSEEDERAALERGDCPTCVFLPA
ncbi:MAG: hypothetical protein AAGA81_03720 [Acidobacteriota bacterium]